MIVTHHAPDLDAIGATWLLKRFDSQHYADTKIYFVNPGDKITESELREFGFTQEEVTHVDTGLGEFDHHQLERSKQHICASSLVYDYLLKVYPDYKDDDTLKELVDFINSIDHFEEVYWPGPADNRYCFMLHELIRGHECVDLHNDDSQMHFGMQCLDYAYASLKQTIKAKKIIEEKGIEFSIKEGKCLAVATRNNDVVKQAQKQGYALVIKKDPIIGHMNIKVRPDINLKLKKLYQQILAKDNEGSWFYHNNEKMLINGSRKHRDQKPTPLSLTQVVAMVKEIYG